MAVSTRASTFGSISRVATTKTAKENPTIRTRAGSPSLNITRKKEKYTRARPVSFCIMESPAGTSAMIAAMSCERGLAKSVSTRDKYFARARFTKILQISAG